MGNQEDVLAAALGYLRRGWSVIPLVPGKKKPDGSVLPKDEKGIPIWGPFQEAPPTKKQVGKWFSSGKRNLGVVLGKVSNLTELDIDRPEAFPFLFGTSVDEVAESTPVIFTGRREAPEWAPRLNRGIKVLLEGVVKPFKIIRTHPSDPKAKAKGLIEVRSTGQQFAAPPSIHPDGHRYSWVKPPPKTMLPAANREIRLLLRPWLVAESLIPFYQEGSRHDVLKSVAAYLRKKRGWPQEDTEKVLERVGTVLGLPAGEVRSRIRETYRKRLDEISMRGFLEHVWGKGAAGQAQELERRLDEVLDQLEGPPGKPGAAPDETPSHGEIAESLLNAYRFAAYPDGRKDVLVYDTERGIYTLADPLVASEAERAMEGGVTKYYVAEVLGHIERRSYVPRERFDKAPGIVVANGLLDPVSGKLSPWDPDRLDTVALPVAWKPGSKCPQFLRFLEAVVTAGDWMLIQESVGYCLLRETPYHKANILVGGGANGKTTFLGVLEALLGSENCSALTLQELGRRFAVHTLHGKLANLAPDTPGRPILDTGVFKAAVSGDRLDAELKGVQKRIGFRPYAKLWFPANAVPRSEDDSDAFYRRWNPIGFPNIFEGAADDTELLEKLTTPEELRGILVWAAEGLQRLLKQGGFSRSRTTEETREEWIRMADPVTAFVGEYVEKDMEAWEEKDDVYEVYVEFSKREGLIVKANRVFTADLKRVCPWVRESQKRVGSRRPRVWLGIRLRKEAAKEEEPRQRTLEEEPTTEEFIAWVERAELIMRTDPKKPDKFVTEDIRREFEVKDYAAAQKAVFEAKNRIKKEKEETELPTPLPAEDVSEPFYRAELFKEAIAYQAEKGSLDAGFFEAKAATGNPVPINLSGVLHTACSTSSGGTPDH